MAKKIEQRRETLEKARYLFTLVILGVQDAFNSLPWTVIFDVFRGETDRYS